jgi:hypothetical protein
MTGRFRPFEQGADRFQKISGAIRRIGALRDAGSDVRGFD